MKKMIKLKQYTPDKPEFGNGICYLQCQDGNDWYKSQPDFSDDTIKIAFNSDDVICAASMDVSKLWPVNMTVVELNLEDIPDGFSTDGSWIIDDTGLHQNKLLINERKKQSLIQCATEEISTLQDKFDVGIATENEESQLAAWKKYRILLRQVDINANYPEWPQEPKENHNG